MPIAQPWISLLHPFLFPGISLLHLCEELIFFSGISLLHPFLFTGIYLLHLCEELFFFAWISLLHPFLFTGISLLHLCEKLIFFRDIFATSFSVPCYLLAPDANITIATGHQVEINFLSSIPFRKDLAAVAFNAKVQQQLLSNAKFISSNPLIQKV